MEGYEIYFMNKSHLNGRIAAETMCEKFALVLRHFVKTRDALIIDFCHCHVMAD